MPLVIYAVASAVCMGAAWGVFTRSQEKFLELGAELLDDQKKLPR
jgi:hypothetical protein